MAREIRIRRGGQLVLAFGSGATAMYLLDPERGPRRRKLARDKLVRTSRELSRMIENGSHDLLQRSQGWLAYLKSLWPQAAVPDDVLVARVRAQIGRHTSHPHALKVTARSGAVELSGPVLAREADALTRSIRRVSGVVEVEDHLERHETAENIPALQGDVAETGPHALVLRERWPPGIRLAGATLGVALAGSGARRRGMVGASLMTLGGVLALRAAFNIPARRMFGLETGERGVDLQKTVTVHAPREEVFRFWTHYENFPRFMDHVIEVQRLDARRSHWRVRGPLGVPVEWTAETTRLQPNELFGWRSLPGSVVGNRGLVRFEDLGEGVTRLDVRMTYNPPAGVLGHGLASIFRTDPKAAMDEDLVRMKSLLESGKTSAHGETVTLDELDAR